MTVRHPYEILLEKIAALVSFAMECAKKPLNEEKITPEIEERLDKLEKDITKFRMVSEAMLADQGIEFKETAKSPSVNKKLPERELLFFSRLEKLQEQAEFLSQGYTADIAAMKKKEIKADEQKKGRARRAKFKNQGIDPNWKPL